MKDIKMLVNGIWPMENRGDFAISIGSAEFLEKNNIELKYVAIESENTDNYLRLKQYFNDRYPGIEVLPNFIGRVEKNYFLRRIMQLYILLLYIFPYKLECIYPNELKRMVDYIKESDFVIHNGGHFFFSFENSNLKTYYFNNYLNLWALKYKKKLILLSQSFGPFEGGKILNMLNKFILKRTFRIFARESISIDYLIKLGIDKTKVKEVLDLAFYMNFTGEITQNKKEEFFLRNNIKKNNFFGVTVRISGSIGVNMDCDEVEHFLTLMADYLEQLCVKFPMYDVVFFPQTKSVKIEEDDIHVAMEIMKKMSSKNVKIISEDMSPELLANVYSDSQLMIANRLHSAIFTLASSTPVISIYNYKMGPKSLGLHKQFKLMDYVFRVDNTNANTLLNKTLSLLENKEEIKEEITHRLSELKTKTNKLVLSELLDFTLKIEEVANEKSSLF